MSTHLSLLIVTCSFIVATLANLISIAKLQRRVTELERKP